MRTFLSFAAHPDRPTQSATSSKQIHRRLPNPLVTNQASYNDRLRRCEFPFYFPILILVSELAFLSLGPVPQAAYMLWRCIV